MRIGLNLLYMLPGIVGGTETYAAGLIGGLAHIDEQNEYYVFVNRESAQWPLPGHPNFTRIVCPVSSAIRVKRYFYEQVRLPNLLKHYRLELVHSLGYVGPLYSPCPSIVTIPDLNFIDLAHTKSVINRLVLRFFSTQAALRANQVITISQFSKERMVRNLRLPAEKLTVTYLAPGKGASSCMIADWRELSRRYGIMKPYVVAFAGGTVHKNIQRLIQAFSAVRDQFAHSLVLIGRLPPGVDFKALTKEGLGHRVLSTGYIPDSHINGILSHADLFVLPSLYEGFGIPVLEAQQANVAVACSTAGSLPEVAGDAAVFFDPNSVDAIAQAMCLCLSNNKLRAELILLGQQNLTRFAWEKTASQTLAVYRKVLND